MHINSSQPEPAGVSMPFEWNPKLVSHIFWRTARVPRRNPVRLSPDSQTKEFRSNYYSLSSSWTNTDELAGWSPKKSKQMNAANACMFAFFICSNFFFLSFKCRWWWTSGLDYFPASRTEKLHRLDGALIVPILFAFDIQKKNKFQGVALIIAIILLR